MNFNTQKLDLDQVDIRKINSITKYPSILTYHKMGEKGRLLDELTAQFSPEDELICTEKIDGTNGRAVIFPQGNIILYGGREELLHAKGDTIYNPSQGIVEAMRPFINRADFRPSTVLVVYGEVYGIKGLPNSKEYSGQGTPGFSVFDIVEHPSLWEFLKRLEDPIEKIALWRDSSGEIPFVNEKRLHEIVGSWATVTPRLNCKPLPTSIADTAEWLRETLPKQSHALLDEGGRGRPEGVVVRTPDRKKVVKIRTEDYERMLRGKSK